MAYLQGIDVGTTGTRALLIDELGNLVSSATHDYPMYTPRIGGRQPSSRYGRSSMPRI